MKAKYKEQAAAIVCDAYFEASNTHNAAHEECCEENSFDGIERCRKIAAIRSTLVEAERLKLAWLYIKGYGDDVRSYISNQAMELILEGLLNRFIDSKVLIERELNDCIDEAIGSFLSGDIKAPHFSF